MIRTRFASERGRSSGCRWYLGGETRLLVIPGMEVTVSHGSLSLADGHFNVLFPAEWGRLFSVPGYARDS
jgi:hypothetical protein